jgi:hypothetical protein
MILLHYRGRLLVAVALLSAALIACEVAIIQLLSYVQWYHYANMVISIALLGFGAAAALLSLKREWLLQHSDALLSPVMMLCGFTMILAVELSRKDFARFDSYLLFVDGLQWLKLILNYMLYFTPFFLGALALGMVFIKYVSEIGSFYFSNMVGSGIGALLGAVLAWYFLPAALPAVTGLMATFASLLVLKKMRWFVLAIGFPVTVFIFFRMIRPADVRLSEYKSLSRTMNLPGAKIVIQRPSPYGFVQIVSANALRYAPGLSLAFNNEVPVKEAVFNNGDWFGPVDVWNAQDSFHLLDYTTMTLPYVLKKRNTVLVLNAGTGLQISHALSHGAQQIDAVEPHKAVSSILRKELAVENDSLFFRPEVTMHITEPRSFLSIVGKKYDLIQLPLIGAFGGGVGLYAMREEYSFTKEAFLKMWNLLENDGVISVTAWMDYPFRNSLKVTATLVETLNHVRIMQHNLHVAAIRSWGTVTYLLKKTPLTAADTSAIRQFCNDYYFDPLLLPGLKAEERSVNNGMNDSSFFVYTDQLVSGNGEKIYNNYDFHIRPATDDKPYFSQFLRWKSLPQLAAIFGSQNVSFIELGWLISAISFLQVTFLAVVLILLPLFRFRRYGTSINKVWTLIYFSGIGIGYMFLEIVLIQKFILFFGNPVYATAITICVMLVASGAGSYYSSGFLPTRALMQRILLIIFLFLLAYTFFLTFLLHRVEAFPNAIKLSISVLLISCPAVVMGMPFPLGLRMQALSEERNVAWAWGINGCMSVISAALAALLSVEVGFSTVLLWSAICYAVSLASMYLIRQHVY